ncbi:MAG TPA: DnaJ domain-containing protein [Candidatus Acidoferrum sp.]|nr:DnaJ domain-containing protein [Candidatus Acidoferrum sp.]
MTDHYELLQVRETAEAEVIQAAFRALARKYHPDFGGDAERMVALNEAWEVLGDKVRRAAYDRDRQALKSPAPAVVITTTPTGYERSTPVTEAPATPRFANDTGTVLDFGRYIGWSIGRLAAEDPDYLEWLARSSVGRRYAPEIYRTLAKRAPVVSTAPPAARKRWGRR